MKKRFDLKSTLLIVSVIILVVALFLNTYSKDSSPSLITGFVNIDDQHLHRLDLDLSVSQSSSFPVSFATGEGRLSSVSVTGNVQGEGSAAVYLDNGLDRMLVFSNLKKKGLGYRKMSAVTGMAIKEASDEQASIGSAEELDYYETVPDGYTSIEGDFKMKCAATCSLPASFLSSNYKLVVLLEPGTQMFLDEISFTVSGEIGK